MTLSTTTTKSVQVSNGVNPVFPFSFKIADISHLVVYEDDVLSILPHNIVLNANQSLSPGGVLTYGLAVPANGTVVVVTRQIPLTQLTNYVDYDSFPAEAHEAALDFAMMAAQQISEQVLRSISLSPGDPVSLNNNIPSPRLNKVLGFDSFGDLTLYDPNIVSGMIPLADKGVANGVAGLDANNKVIRESALNTTSIASMRLSTPVNGAAYYLKSHTTAGDGGGGQFRGITGSAPGTYTDNNGTIIVPAGGDGSAAWLREIADFVTLAMFGSKSDGVTDDAIAVQSALDTGHTVHAGFGVVIYAPTLSLLISTPGQKLYLNGSSLIVSDISIQANDVEIDLGGGKLIGTLKSTSLTATATGGDTTISVLDGTVFIPGDAVGTSYGDNVADFPFGGNSGMTVASSTATTVTFTAPLSGALTVPIGINIGKFIWKSFIVLNASKRVHIYNGSITNTEGYFLSSWRSTKPDFLTNIPEIMFSNIEFSNNGLDQFLLCKTKMTCNDCSFLPQLDVAKQGFVYSDGVRLTLNRCNIARGNFDMDFFPVDSASLGTWFADPYSHITVTDSSFDGKNVAPTNQYFGTDSLHCVNMRSGSAYDGIAPNPPVAIMPMFNFTRCVFVNYSRSIFSCTVIASTQNMVTERVVFTDCNISSQAFNLPVAAGKSISIKTFEFNRCSFYSTGTTQFTSGGNIVSTAMLVNCQIQAIGASPDLQNVKLVNSRISGGALKYHEGVECVDLALEGTSSLRPYLSNTPVNLRGSLIIAGVFADASGNITSRLQLGVDTTFPRGQTNGVMVRAKDGTLLYRAIRYNNQTKVIPTVSVDPIGKISGLQGNDWLVNTPNVIGLAGQVFKTTFGHITSTTAAAAAGSTSIAIVSIGPYNPSYVAVGDNVLIQLLNGSVHSTTIAGTYVLPSLTIPLTDALTSAVDTSAGVNFFRTIQL